MILLPARVTVVEVGPRDGLQSLFTTVPTETKVALITRLVDAGFTSIEATSFTRPDIVPNLADAEAVMAQVPRRPGLRYRALAPNRRGAERAVAAGCDEVSGLVTVSETYSQRNQNMSVDAAVDQAIAAGEVCAQAGIDYVVAVGLAMFCHYEGRIPLERTMAVLQRLHEGGVRRFSLAASTGMENPRDVNVLFHAVAERWPEVQTGLHIHSRNGLAPANTLAALEGGALWVEGSIGGIGRGGMAMPKELGAIGNMPSEDIVHMLEEMGVETGVRAADAVAAASDIRAMLGAEGGIPACR
jgi:hydroxymethylglutaryl-CoA lyase